MKVYIVIEYTPGDHEVINAYLSRERAEKSLQNEGWICMRDATSEWWTKSSDTVFREIVEQAVVA